MVHARLISVLAVVFPAIWLLLFLFFKSPVFMVLYAGVISSVILFLVVIAAFHFRYYRLKPGFRPGLVYDFFLWLSMIVIFGIGAYGILQLLQ